jgi:hypothetical protein
VETDFKAKTLRICKIRVRGLFFNYALICVHAPTEEKDDDKRITSMKIWIRFMKSAQKEMHK